MGANNIVGLEIIRRFGKSKQNVVTNMVPGRPGTWKLNQKSLCNTGTYGTPLYPVLRRQGRFAASLCYIVNFEARSDCTVMIHSEQNKSQFIARGV